MCRALFLFTFLCFTIWHNSYGQCELDISQPIPDTTVTTVFVEISGLQLGSLEDPGQGVCGVEIEFRHSYLGDLQIELISPEGHSVVLVGPFTAATLSTSLASWDVTFLPCGFPVAPDAGFANTWNNNQTWAALGSYTGSYHPNNGCLEDFDAGPANGLWQLRIIDNDDPQTGQIISFTLIFCDNTGLTCSLCSAQGGDLTSAQITICEGESIAASDYEGVNFENPVPDPDLYGYTYFLNDGQNVLQLNDNISTPALSPGNYQICGLSYSIADSAEIHDFITANSISDIQTSIDDGEFCASLSPLCLPLEILAPQSSDLNAEICTGATFTLGNQTFDEPGNYQVVFQSVQGCDSTVNLQLSLADPVAIIDHAGPITCNSAIVLNGGNSIGSNPGYSWFAISGNIVGATDQATITIDLPGLYVLQLSANGCTASDTIFVQGASNSPFAFAGGDTLSCAQQTGMLSGVVFPTNVDFFWSGPNGFFSLDLNPVISDPGLYILEVIDSLGCSQTAFAEVLADTITPVALIGIIEKDCENQVYKIRAFPSAQESYFWSGPAGFSSEDRTIDVSVAGTYNLTITANNGCQAYESVFLDNDFTIPQINLSPQTDTLNCDEVLLFEANTGNPSDSVVWRRPIGTFHDSIAILVRRPGIFTVTVYGESGCISRDTFEVIRGDDLFEIEVLADTINCNSDTAELIAVADDLVNIEWQGPGLLTNNNDTVIANRPGVYGVMAMNAAGCTQRVEVVLIEDKDRPRVMLLADTFNCFSPTIEVTYIANSPISDFEWRGPGGTMYTDSVVTTSIPGVYRLNATGTNGCSRNFNITPLTDTVPPIFFLESDVLGCADSIPINIVQVDTLVSYAWNGPNGYNYFSHDAFASIRGTYSLTAVGTNNCESTVSLLVDTTLFVPEVSILGEQLNCNDPDIFLQGMVNSIDLILEWQDTFGSILSTEDILTVTEPGIYYFSAMGEGICRNTDSFEVLPLAIPSIFFQSDSIDCYDDAQVLANSDLTDVTYAWTGPMGFLSDQDSISIGVPGIYSITVEASNGCTSDSTITISIDTIPPLAIATSGGILRCEQNTVSLDATLSLGNEIEYLWTTTNGGNITAGDSTSLAIADSPGQYLLQVTDLVNGCIHTDTVLVIEEDNPLLTAFYGIIAECFDNGNGSILIDSVAAADVPITFSLNGSVPQSSGSFSQLTGGEYVLTITDTFGCTLDTLIEVPHIQGDFAIDLGSDILVQLGDTAELPLESNIDNAIIDQILWNPLPLDTCSTCFSALYLPLSTTTVHVAVNTLFGCTLEDKVTINVEEKARAYVPNIFSPNYDGVNDNFEIFLHRGVSRISSLRVYDRWGNVVYGLSNVPASPGVVNWDGRFEGKMLTPAVFVYVLELELINGKKEILHGNLTLVR